MPNFTSWGTVKGLLIVVPLLSLIFFIFNSLPQSPDYHARHSHGPVLQMLHNKNRTTAITNNSNYHPYLKNWKHNFTSTSTNNVVVRNNKSSSVGKNATLETNVTSLSSNNTNSSLNRIEPVLPVTLTQINSLHVLDSANVTTSLPLCPDISNELQGKIPVIQEPVPSISTLEKQFVSWLKPGGHWEPKTCRVLTKVAIIVPFRSRGKHLLLFLNHMHPFLKKQQLDYTIFVIEQEGTGPFNRAMLMNVGYIEALKVRDYDCFIFHDVDLLPEDDRNIYSCPEQPRHMSVAVDNLGYKLPYHSIFGGVCALTKDHFKLLNGFSNSFWGWGGEDDDMSSRIRYHNLYIARYPYTIARYVMIKHKKDKPSPNRYDVLSKGSKKFDKDGLNSLQYDIVMKKFNLLYTWILVKLHRPPKGA